MSDTIECSDLSINFSSAWPMNDSGLVGMESTQPKWACFSKSSSYGSTLWGGTATKTNDFYHGATAQPCMSRVGGGADVTFEWGGPDGVQIHGGGRLHGDDKHGNTWDVQGGYNNGRWSGSAKVDRDKK